MGIRRILSVVLGLLLLTTAVLKAQGPSDGPLSQNMILFSPRVQVAVIEAEVLLGLWLLSGWARRGAWLASLVFFLGLAGTSLYLGLTGQSSCGCFGRIAVSPWGAFGLDVVCLAALIGWRPPLRNVANVDSPGWRKEGFTIALGASVILVVVVGLVLLTAGHPANFLARLRGETVSVEPAISDVGTDVPGQSRAFSIRIHNCSERTVKIIGGTTDCSCITTDDLPVAILPGGSVPVSVRFRFKGTAGLFQHQFIFYTDDEYQRQIVARFKGRVIASPGP